MSTLPEQGSLQTTSQKSSHEPAQANTPDNAGELPIAPGATHGDNLGDSGHKPISFIKAKRDGERAARPSDINVSSGRYNSLEPTSPPRSMAHATGAAIRRSSSPFGNQALRSASPRHLSPATSQIFERDVQESSLAPELSPAIPSHIQTEDHIPPVLEASSLAITDNHLNPDEVEIVTHSAHQPAAVVTGSAGDVQTALHASHVDLVVPSEQDDSNSTYGAVDPMDPRRLSFISFADVVHAEQVETGKDSIHGLNMSSTTPSVAGKRSPSPLRSPVSPERVPVSYAPGYSASNKPGETSPVRGGAASITSGHGPTHGELTIETMRQTLQHVGANDETGIPLSATSPVDNTAHRSFK